LSYIFTQGGTILRKYETVLVIDSLLKAEEIENIIKKYERFISANGGEIENLDRWGKKRLAYEIKKRQYGYYVLFRFNGPPIMIKQLEREFRLNEALLRYQTIQMEKKALRALEARQLKSSIEPVKTKSIETDESTDESQISQDDVITQEAEPATDSAEKSQSVNIEEERDSQEKPAEEEKTEEK
jgi:small subunit ribosomal protein S6